MSKVEPLGGAHQSASSMLAEAMADPEITRCVVAWWGKDGVMHYGQYGVTRAELAYAGAMFTHNATHDETI